MSRRNFLTLAAGLSVQPLIQIARGNVNDRVRVAIVGVNGRANALMKSLHRIREDNVEVAALCDVDSAVLAKRAAEFEKLSKTESFVEDDTAASLSRRTFRQPYAIRDAV